MVPYRRIFEELEQRQIRYLIAGGFAVNLQIVAVCAFDLEEIVEAPLAFTEEDRQGADRIVRQTDHAVGRKRLGFQRYIGLLFER